MILRFSYNTKAVTVSHFALVLYPHCLYRANSKIL